MGASFPRGPGSSEVSLSRQVQEGHQHPQRQGRGGLAGQACVLSPYSEDNCRDRKWTGPCPS